MKFSELHHVKRILRKLFPSAFPVTEYVASSVDGLPCLLKCVAIVDGKRFELLQQPSFLGYKPLVMGIYDVPARIESLTASHSVVLEYINKSSKKKVASLFLRIDQVLSVEGNLLVLLVGISGEQQLELTRDRIAFRLNTWLTKKAAGNIDLTPAEYDQLKIAYSIPRPIRMLRVFSGETTNAFPIDLFGWVGASHFVLSLRHEKKSAQQVSSADRIEIHSVHATQAAQTYASGRFHSADMIPCTAADEFSAGVDLERVKTIGDFGVHRIFLFRTGSPAPRPPEQEREQLVHVHRSYANWHKRQGFPLKEIPH
jgi:hypothetical protein